MAQVFISYRHVEPDESVARFLHRHLSELDHDVFIDARDIPVGSFWDKEIAANVARAQYFVPLVSLSYLHSRYILDKELAVAARLLKERQIERILQVNLAFDGEAPREVREVVEQVQHFKWRSPEDTPRLAEEIAARLPSPQALVKGMRSFDVSDARPFKQLGRASEVADFLALLRQDPARHVLLHGVSGAGKTSFLKAGVLPRLGDPPPPVFELSEKVCEEFAAAAAGGGALIFLDQFEQALIRLANDEAEHRAFAAAVESFTRGRPASRLVFCIRDEYRTAFDTMLPEVSRRCARFPLLPLRPEVAASVLALMLDDARAEYDADFLPGLCAERLAEGVPKTVLPALLQMVAQYCRNRGGKLDKGLWDGLMLSGGSLFEDHVREAVLEKVPSRLPRVQAAQALAALTAGVVKSRPLSAAQIADDYQLKEEVVGRTLEVSTLPHARVVLAEADEERKETRYRLVHDLFAPAVQALARETKLAREKRRRNQLVGLFAGLAALSLAAGAAAWWQRGVARRQGEIAVARQLAMQSNGLRAADAGGLMRSLLFAAESHRLYPNADSDASVRAALALAPLHVARLEHKTIVNAAPRFSRDGAMLVTGGFGGGVRVWDVGARRPLANFDAGQPVNRVAFSRGGAAVAAGAGGQDMKGNPNPNGVALAWDVRGGRELARADFVSPVVDVAFVGDTGRLAAVASEAAKVFGGDGSPPLTIPLGEGVGATALSPDGGLLAVAKGLRVELYELPSGRLLATLDVGAEDVLPASAGRTEPTPAHKSIFGLAFDAGGARLAAAAGAGVIRVWDVAARRPLATIKEPVERTSFLALSDDGALVAYTNYYGTTGVWHVESGTRVASIVPDTRAFNAFSTAMRTVFRPGSHDLFTPGGGSSARMHRIFDARGRVSVRDGAFEALRLMPGTRGITAPLAASPDGRHVVTVQYGEVDLWELKGGAAAAEALGSYRAAFSPSGRYFAAQTTGDRVEVFDLE
ncbi:MAG TPA: TIR domain-containing protein, partial [Pyrinomonadaceae bacterium]